MTIPARNEEESICCVIKCFQDKASVMGINLMIQVVDDRSTDNTANLASSMGCNVRSIKNSSGLADTFRAEIDFALQTDADIIIHVDADGQYLADDLFELIGKIHEGYDLVLGNRLSQRPEGMSQLRYDGNVWISSVISEVVNFKISDSQTGYRVFTRELADRVKIKSLYTYTQEQILRSAFYGYGIAEVPIKFVPRRFGYSRLMNSPFHYLASIWTDIDSVVNELYFDRLRSF